MSKSPSATGGPVMKIVDVFVKDTLKGSYPVVIECQGRPAEDEFVDQVRNGMDRGFYSADDIKAAKFVVREAGAVQRARSSIDLRKAHGTSD
jgi:hypothetical protein